MTSSPIPLVASQAVVAGTSVLWLLSACAIGQAQTPVIPSEATSPRTFEVLEQQGLVFENGRRIICNRVVPPPARVPASAAIISAAASSAAPVPPAESSKPQRMLMLSCTVYDGPITELRWSMDGRSHHAFSNVDFLDLASIGHFETADTSYSVFLGVGKSLPEQRASGEPALPARTEFNGGHAQYLLLSSAQTPVENDPGLLAMDALHAFFNANQAALQEQRRQREEQALEQQRLEVLRASQPPPDVIIHYWPIKGRAARGETP